MYRILRLISLVTRLSGEKDEVNRISCQKSLSRAEMTRLFAQELGHSTT